MKKILMFVSLFAAASLFAALAPDYENTKMITFSTLGPDTYADGSTVLDGECYALVWSKDGVFEGIQADGTPVDSNDKVLYIGSFAKGGCCPTVVFTILEAEAGVSQGGVYDVFLLDTRRYINDKEVKVGKTSEGVVAVNKAVKVAAKVAVGGADAQTTVSEGKKAENAVAVPASAGQPVITDFKVDGDYLVLTVTNTVGYLNYAAAASETYNGDETAGSPKIGVGNPDDPITLVAPKTADKGFIKVIRK